MKLFLSSVILLTQISVINRSMASSQICQEIFLPQSKKIPPVFRLPHNEEILEETTDGPAYRHIHLDQWFADDYKLDQQILNESKQTSEPILELKGKSSVKNMTFTMQSKKGWGASGGTARGVYGFGHSTGIRLKVSSAHPNTDVTIILQNNYLKKAIAATFKADTATKDITYVGQILKKLICKLHQMNTIPFFYLFIHLLN